ncbi:MAG: hypothetical protein JWL84_1062 [Rhodospirillales bacterium]|nr:hypothetical protein [Rhodospirillales bacterium]
MADMVSVTQETAQTLVERYGRNAMVHVEDQVKVALKRSDWISVRSWRAVGSEIARQFRIPG